MSDIREIANRKVKTGIGYPDDMMLLAKEWLREHPEQPEESWEFVEPHSTGGHCVVTITRSQIIAFQRGRGLTYSDKKLVDEFVVVHWARKVC